MNEQSPAEREWPAASRLHTLARAAAMIERSHYSEHKKRRLLLETAFFLLTSRKEKS